MCIHTALSRLSGGAPMRHFDNKGSGYQQRSGDDGGGERGRLVSASIVRQPAELEAIFLSGALKVESWYAKGGVDGCVQIADGRMGYIGTVRDDVPHLLGRPATTLRQWAAIYKDQLLAFTAIAAAA